MTTCRTCRPFGETPEQAEYDAGFAFTFDWARFESEDAVDQEMHDAQVLLDDRDITPARHAYYSGVLNAVLAYRGEPLQCICADKEINQ